MKQTKAAPKCRAIGCSRKTKAVSGYCWAHVDMLKFKKKARKP